jgi:hypothetical protein
LKKEIRACAIIFGEEYRRAKNMRKNRMKNTGIRKSVIAAGLVLALAFAGTACTEKLYSDPDMTSTVTTESLDPMSFAAIDSKIRDYNFGINEYMKNHASEATQKKKTGATPNGQEAACTYTISADGKYESLQMEKNISNGVQIDEYFNLGDSMFIARTTVYNDGNFEPVDKYYIIDGCLYKLDGSSDSVTLLVNINDAAAAETKSNLDLYFTFDEIRALYA